MANFPTSVSTNANLYIAITGLQTTLAVAVGTGDATLTLASTSGFPSTGMVTVDNTEVVAYTGVSGADLTGCTRGADGTTAVSHAIGVTVGLTVAAAHHNLLKDEVIAIETALGAGYVNPTFGNLTAASSKVAVTGGTGAVKGSGTTVDLGTVSLDDLSNVTVPSPTTNDILSWNGSAWVNIANAAGITQLTSDVTAGPGSGSQAATVVNVGGQSAANVAGAVTTANNALPKAGGTMSGAIAMGTNKITGLGNGTASTDAAAFGQIYGGFQAPIQATTATSTTTTSATYVDTNITASITPTSASHRVKVTVSTVIDSLNTGAYPIITLVRDSTDLALNSNGFANGSVTSTQPSLFPASICYIDTPATTSATTYKVQLKSSLAINTVQAICGATSVIILEEIV
jgi:hypothetical protein